MIGCQDIRGDGSDESNKQYDSCTWAENFGRRFLVSLAGRQRFSYLKTQMIVLIRVQDICSLKCVEYAFTVKQALK